jgi:hypothetical protein
VVHDAGRYYELSLIEAEILRDVNGAGGRGTTHCCVLLNFFKLDGHACMVCGGYGGHRCILEGMQMYGYS